MTKQNRTLRTQIRTPQALLLALVLGALMLPLQLVSCAASESERIRAQSDADLADTTKWDARSDVELHIKDNRKVGQIRQIDSILCTHVAGSEGRVYFDEPIWTNLSPDQRLSLGQCLAEKRRLVVTTLEKGAKGVRIWTARLSSDERRLLIGTLQSDCIICTLNEGQYEYSLQRHGDTLEAQRLTEAELWR